MIDGADDEIGGTGEGIDVVGIENGLIVVGDMFFIGDVLWLVIVAIAMAGIGVNCENIGMQQSSGGSGAFAFGTCVLDPVFADVITCCLDFEIAVAIVGGSIWRRTGVDPLFFDSIV